MWPFSAKHKKIKEQENTKSHMEKTAKCIGNNQTVLNLTKQLPLNNEEKKEKIN